MKTLRGLTLYLTIIGIISAQSNEERQKRNIGIFNVVRFPNDVCQGTNNNEGTCYTTEECDDNSGTADGSCADGYGVCCTFSVGCGGRSSQNNTVFMSNNPPANSACNAVICKAAENIGQLRLDFTTFVISNPAAGTGSGFFLLNGVVDPTMMSATTMNNDGLCLQDSFSVTSPGSSGSPVICGTNSGDHIYIDASEACNTLSFVLGTNPQMQPMWAITVRQYPEDYTNRAPPGCLQWHFDNDDVAALNTGGVIRSFNWNNGGGRHLANQDQTICIRRDEGILAVCFSQTGGMIVNDFLISSGAMGDAAMPHTASGLVGNSMMGCGNYGAMGTGIDFDFLNIPQAFNLAAMMPADVMGNNNFCGAALFAVAAPALTTAGMPAGAMIMAPATICTANRPFRVRFVSDGGEVVAKETIQSGFNLNYQQIVVAPQMG